MKQSVACGLHCTKINKINVKFGKETILKDVNIIRNKNKLSTLKLNSIMYPPRNSSP